VIHGGGACVITDSFSITLEQYNWLQQTKEELKLSKSAIVRLAIEHFRLHSPFKKLIKEKAKHE